MECGLLSHFEEAISIQRNAHFFKANPTLPTAPRLLILAFALFFKYLQLQVLPAPIRLWSIK
jgi:hypothetical protein